MLADYFSLDSQLVFFICPHQSLKHVQTASRHQLRAVQASLDPSYVPAKLKLNRISTGKHVRSVLSHVEQQLVPRWSANGCHLFQFTRMSDEDFEPAVDLVAGQVRCRCWRSQRIATDEDMLAGRSREGHVKSQNHLQIGNIYIHGFKKQGIHLLLLIVLLSLIVHLGCEPQRE